MTSSSDGSFKTHMIDSRYLDLNAHDWISLIPCSSCFITLFFEFVLIPFPKTPSNHALNLTLDHACKYSSLHVYTHPCKSLRMAYKLPRFQMKPCTARPLRAVLVFSHPSLSRGGNACCFGRKLCAGPRWTAIWIPKFFTTISSTNQPAFIRIKY